MNPQFIESPDGSLPSLGEGHAELAHALDQGYCVIEVLFDGNEEPRDYRFVYVNRLFEGYTGIAPEDALSGKTARDIVPGLEDYWVQTYGKVALSGEPVQFQAGSEAMGRWFEVRAFRLGGGDSRTVGVLFKDVMEERKAAKEKERLTAELEAERTRLRDAFENAPAFIAILRGPGLVFEHVNAAYYQIVGHRPIVGLPLAEALPETVGGGEGRDYDDLLLDIMRRGDPVRFEARPVFLQRTPGAELEQRLLDLSYQPLRKADGEVDGIMVLGVDVTEQTRARRAQAQSEARYRALAAASSDVAYGMSSDWSVMLPLDGRGLVASNEVPVRGWLEKNIPQEEHARIREGIAQATGSKSLFELEHRVRRLDGSIGWTRSRAIPILDDNGDIVEWFGAASDISDRKRAEEELREGVERQGFLLALSDALRPLTEPADIAVLASERLGERFGMSRVFYAEIDGARMTVERDYANGVDSIAGVQDLSAFGPELLAAYRDGKIVTVDDVATDPRFGDEARAGLLSRKVGAYVDVVLFRREQSVGLLAVQSATPRKWTQAEQGLFREFGERVRFAIERARTEAALRESEERYRDLFESVDEGYCIIEVIFDSSDPSRAVDYRFRAVNPAFEAQSGMSDVIGRRMLEFVPSIEPHWLENYGRVALTGEPIRFEGEYTGLFRWFEVYAFRVGEPNARNVAVLFSDITNRKRAEAALRESEERFRAMADNSPMMVWVTEPGGSCTFLSQRWYEFTGQTPDTGLGYGWIDATHPDDRAMAERVFVEADENRAPFSVEFRLRRADGEYGWAIDSARPRFGASGEFLGYVGSVIDITERRAAEEALRRSNEELEAKVLERTGQLAEAVKEAEGFNYSVAHDLRAPVRAVASTSRILLDDLGPDLSQEFREMLERQVVNAKRLGTLIDELLRLSRLARAEVRSVPLDISAKARSVAAEIDPPCRIDVQDGMTAAGDPELVRTVLHNLIGNSCKFSPEGGLVRVGQTDGAFFVRDEGIGFDMQYAPKLFLPFERLVTEEQFEGTGIGLANVERIVRRHGGRVWAESDGPGTGATFYFTLG